jgi:hypothetical protein
MEIAIQIERTKALIQKQSQNHPRESNILSITDLAKMPGIESIMRERLETKRK